MGFARAAALAAALALVAAASLAVLAGLVAPGTTTVTTVTEVRTVFETVTRELLVTVPVTVTAAQERIELVDALGRLVVLESPPERLVSLAPSVTEIVCALGACGLLVGVDSFSNYPPEVAEAVREGRIAVVGGYSNPDVEKILALDPDLVIGSAAVPAHRELAGAIDVPVLLLRAGLATGFDDIYRDIMLVAAALNRSDAGERLVEEIRSRIEAVEARLAEANATRVPVLVLLGSPEWGVWAAGGGTFIDAVVSAAGGSNTASRFHGWVMLGPEELSAMSPHLVLVAAMAVNASSAEALLSKWVEALSAANTNYTVICVAWGPANDVLVRPGPRVADAVELVASLLHPNLFSPPPGLGNYVVCKARS